MMGKRLQKLPAPTSAPRVETGAVQFGDDWPGLFLRGDQCIELIGDIQSMMEQIGAARLATLDLGTGAALAELVKRIKSEVIVPRKDRKQYEDAKDCLGLTEHSVEGVDVSDQTFEFKIKKTRSKPID